MFRFQTVVVFMVSACIALGCGVVPRSYNPQHRTVNADATDTVSATSRGNERQKPVRAMGVSSQDETQASLMQAYRDWKGTPYVLGGETQQGVDCSRFVNIVFDDYFGVDLPTNTRTQLNAGDSIRRAGVRTGDLVFFRTGRKTLHVGIAVNRGEFLHASTSNGVMISKLGNSYWRNRFLAARRVL